ncbi:MAG: THUMP domain-containing protein, partial [Bacteroidota bacterium]
MELLAKTFHGLEPVLAKELEDLGATDIRPITRGVRFAGDQELLYRANLHLRTALRILKPVYTFEATHEKALYQATLDLPWSEHLNLDQTFAIDSVVFSDLFKHSKYVALKMKDAIVDRFRAETGKRPSIDTHRPDLRINVHVSGSRFSISFDSSGDSLHKRGYRQRGHQAPLNEVLAAGMLLLAGWHKNIPLIDPMCGTGTIPFEAALMARNRAPGIHQQHFGFTRWNDFDRALWKRLQTEAKDNESQPRVQIFASDIDGGTLDQTRVTAIDHDLNRQIRFSRSAFERLKPPTDSGLIVTNPPYGERIGRDENIIELYRNIGNNLKQNYQGFDAWVLSSNVAALKQVGLRPSAKHTLFNGPLECR